MSHNTRRRAREAALQILYRYDVALSSANTPIPTGDALAKDLIKHFEHFEVQQAAREFAGQLVAGTIQEITSLDGTIERHATNWKVSRMAMIDRNILRIAAYEILRCPDIPAAVTIDGAVELSKQFGSEETPAFVNGILDSVKNETTSSNS